MSNQFPFAYIRKKFCKTEQAVVSIQSKAVQYGIGVFTGIRGYYNKDDKNIYLFRLDEHFKRMRESAKITGMKFDYTFEKYKSIIIELIKKNKAREDIYIRPTLYCGSIALTPRFDNPKDDDLALYMISLGNYFAKADGLNVCVSSFRRFDDDSISTKAKINGSYVNSALAKTEAVMNGYDEALFLNRDGKVCEASGANIFGIKDGIVFTPPLSANNLNGITRRTVIELFRNELGTEVREENFDRSMLYTFDELFFTGTAAKVSPIRSVDKRIIGSGKLGKLTEKLQKVFDKISSNRLPEYNKWLTKVY